MSSFDYNQEERPMQPFSIPEPMLQHLWGGSHSRKLCLGWVTRQEAVSGVGHMAGSCVWGGPHDRKLCLGWVT